MTQRAIAMAAAWAVAVMVWMVPSMAEAQVVLVDDGQAQAVVVIPDEPTETARYAANELVDHIERAAGVRLQVAEESQVDAAARRVYIGATRAARSIGIDPDALAPEVAVLRTHEGSLYIVGRDQPGDPLNQRHIWAGTLWGVYEVLERDLGVRWLWPGDLGVHVPEARTVRVSAWDARIEPRLERRNLRQLGRGDGPLGFSDEGMRNYRHAESTFLRRHRMGQSHEVTPYSTGHSFTRWWADYGQEHPEWFQMQLDGTRGPANPDRPYLVSMCVSNPDFQQKIVDLFAADRVANPDRPPIRSIGENDVHLMCACEDCRAWDDPQPSPREWAQLPRYARGMYHPFNPSGRYARFWKAVHDRMREVEPDAIVTAFAYTSYFPAPTSDIELHPNIIVSFVPYARRAPELMDQRSFWFPRHADEQQWVRDQWDGWRRTGATLYYRPNYTLDGYTMPHNYARQFAENFQYILNHGAKATDFDALVGQWATQGPTMYLLARMHVRPEADVDALLEEYYQAFGPAAEAVRAYFDYWEDHTMDLLAIEDQILAWYATRRLHTYPRFAHQFFPPESFEPAQAILDRAAAAAQGHDNPRYRQRVAYLQLGLDHARLCIEAAIRFDDPHATPAHRREALEALAAFRRSTQDRFIASYGWINRQERRAWGEQEGFIGGE